MVSIKEKDFWTDFIEQYHSFPCLWEVNIKEYSNKILREEALQVLVEKCREQDPNTDKEYVRKRIANLRTAFSREYKKIENSKRTGSSADSIYEPSLWYYDLLLFLKSGEISRKGHSSLSCSTDENSLLEECIAPEAYFSPPQIPDGNSPGVSRPSSASSSQPRKKKSLEQQQKNFFENASKYMTRKEGKDEDEFDILGKRIAEHFRSMEAVQCLIAEKIITDALITGRMYQLTMNSAFISNSSASQSHQTEMHTSTTSTNSQGEVIFESEISEFLLLNDKS